MNVDSIPSDSLYKFLAISGLLILGIPNLYLEWSFFELALKVSETTELLELEQLEMEIWERDYQRVAPPSAAANEEVRDLETRNNNLMRANAKIGALQERTKILLDVAKRNHVLRIGSTATGLLMTFSGFWLWYARLQKPLDEKLRRESVGD